MPWLLQKCPNWSPYFFSWLSKICPPHRWSFKNQRLFSLLIKILCIALKTIQTSYHGLQQTPWFFYWAPVISLGASTSSGYQVSCQDIGALEVPKHISLLFLCMFHLVGWVQGRELYALTANIFWVKLLSSFAHSLLLSIGFGHKFTEEGSLGDQGHEEGKRWLLITALGRTRNHPSFW